MKYVKYTACLLTLIGALNWGLVGLFGFDLVTYLFGTMSILSRIIYALVGLSAIATAYFMHRCNQTRISNEKYSCCRM